MKIYRVEVTGPLSIWHGKECWLVLAFDDRGIKVGQFETNSEADALEIKDKLMRIFVSKPWYAFWRGR